MLPVLRRSGRSAWLSVRLYETHIPVTDTKASEIFYTEVVGLPFAYRDPTRDIVFLWAHEREVGMIGLWGANTRYGPRNGVPTECHLAFSVSLEELERAIVKLNELGIQTFGFNGKPSTEPTVIGWMPSAQIYFRDPDGHLLEFIAILPEGPKVSFVGSYSGWLKLNRG